MEQQSGRESSVKRSVKEKRATPSRNTFPECAYLDLYMVPSSKAVLLDLALNEGRLRLTNTISLRFGIREGELRLVLKNCSMPVEKRRFLTRLQPHVEIKRTVKAANKRVQSAEDSSALTVRLQPSTLGAEVHDDRKNTNSKTTDIEQSDEFIVHKSQVSTMGDPFHPGWLFQAPGGEAILRGALQKQSLGSLLVLKRPFTVNAQFTTSRGNIRITSTEGIPSLLSPDKRAVMRLVLIRQIYTKMNKGVLSSLDRTYG